MILIKYWEQLSPKAEEQLLIIVISTLKKKPLIAQNPILQLNSNCSLPMDVFRFY